MSWSNSHTRAQRGRHRGGDILEDKPLGAAGPYGMDKTIFHRCHIQTYTRRGGPYVYVGGGDMPGGLPLTPRLCLLSNKTPLSLVLLWAAPHVTLIPFTLTYRLNNTEPLPDIILPSVLCFIESNLYAGRLLSLQNDSSAP